MPRVAQGVRSTYATFRISHFIKGSVMEKKNSNSQSWEQRVKYQSFFKMLGCVVLSPVFGNKHLKCQPRPPGLLQNLRENSFLYKHIFF